ncbi:MAG: chromate resistance protein [Gammaproteobacteria bacterium]|nr:chromate resistance protein [Gammaproteobacteria bacterium]
MHDDRPTRWLVFTTSLLRRTQSTPRVRLWRSLKELGATSLRDGVTLLPATAANRTKLEAIGEQVEGDGGTTWLFELPVQRAGLEERIRSSFNRREGYLELQAHMAALGSELPRLDEAAARRRLRRMEQELKSIVLTDFFPDETSARTTQALAELTDRINSRFSPREPSTAEGDVGRVDRQRYRGLLWATRRHLWVDRVASAWLIRRFIDSEARFLWLGRPEDCPGEAVGFDFDGAAFTHIGPRVTFEVLLSSFELDTDPGLTQLGRLVHYLDVGGEAVAEAAGFEAILAGLRESAADDDILLDATTPVLDALHRRFSGPEP